MQSLTRVGRDTGILTTAEVNYIRSQVIRAAWPTLIGRTFMPVKNLGSWGYLKETFYTENDMTQAIISMMGEEKSEDISDLTEHEVKIPVISKDFRIKGRDVASARLSGRDLNTQQAENAARQCAEEEDKLIITGEYTGWPALGIQGLATITNRNTTAGGDWSANYLTYVSAAKAAIEADGLYGRKVLIIKPAWMSQLDALVSNTAVLARTVLENMLGGPQNILVTDNLFSSAGGSDNALLVDTTPDNFELIVGEDYTVVGPHQLPGEDIYKGKVRVVAVPIIHRPTAICEITSLT
jgi:uncharacterized linocin/CFP29 family protein